MGNVVYIIRSNKTGKFYVGESEDFARRLEQHNRGNVSSTKGKGPWELYYKIDVADKTEGLILEKKLKNLRSTIRLLKFIEKHKQNRESGIESPDQV